MLSLPAVPGRGGSAGYLSRRACSLPIARAGACRAPRYAAARRPAHPPHPAYPRYHPRLRRCGCGRLSRWSPAPIGSLVPGPRGHSLRMSAPRLCSLRPVKLQSQRTWGGPRTVGPRTAGPRTVGPRTAGHIDDESLGEDNNTKVRCDALTAGAR